MITMHVPVHHLIQKNFFFLEIKLDTENKKDASVSESKQCFGIHVFNDCCISHAWIFAFFINNNCGIVCSLGAIYMGFLAWLGCLHADKLSN